MKIALSFIAILFLSACINEGGGSDSGSGTTVAPINVPITQGGIEA